MFAALSEVKAAGTTVLMIEQNLVDAVRICDAVVLVVAGEVRGQRAADVFLKDPQVHKLFLGQTREAGNASVHAGGIRGASAA